MHLMQYPDLPITSEVYAAALEGPIKPRLVKIVHLMTNLDERDRRATQ